MAARGAAFVVLPDHFVSAAPHEQSSARIACTHSYDSEMIRSSCAHAACCSARRFSSSCALTLAASIFIAVARFECCERSFCEKALMPVGVCVSRTADSVAEEKGFPETAAAVKEFAAAHAG